MKFRKKPVVIEAILFDGTVGSWEELCDTYTDSKFWLNENNKLSIQTLEGLMEAKVGDYVIRGVKGEVYSCDAEIFHMTYEAVND